MKFHMWIRRVSRGGFAALLVGLSAAAGCANNPGRQAGHAVKSEPRIPFSEFVTGEKAASPHSWQDCDQEIVPTDMDLKREGVQYVGFSPEIPENIMNAAGVDGVINVRYYECAEGAGPGNVNRETPFVHAYVAFNGSVEDAVERGSIHTPAECYPVSGFNAERTDVVTLKHPGYCGGEATMSKTVFYRDGGQWVLVYYHMNRNGTVLSADAPLDVDDRHGLPEDERSGFLAQVQFFTVIGTGRSEPGGISEEKIREAEERVERFCPLFLEKLGGFLPTR